MRASLYVRILLCDYFHLRYLYAGSHLVQSVLQRKYWIIGVRSLIRSRIHKCLRCHKLRVQSLQPLMSDLPSARVTPSRPFSRVGTDFAGSFSLKLSGRKSSSISEVTFVSLSVSQAKQYILKLYLLCLQIHLLLPSIDLLHVGASLSLFTRIAGQILKVSPVTSKK